MAKTVLVEGDMAQFLPVAGQAVLIGALVAPMQASGTMTVMGKKVCLEGDEANVKVMLNYIAGPYVIPGMGTLIIKQLDSGQIATKTENSKKLLLQGGFFDSEFQVSAPAQQPTPTGPVPDGTPKYNGKGQFISTNLKLVAT